VNLGDCRAVLCRNGQAIELSQDHKATLQSEINRVKLKGGVIVCGRVAGRLSVARAFGNHELKM
jgi:serine/threonine protein phosphatase PrpC